MKVLVVIDDLLVGGAEKNLLEMVLELRREMDFSIVTLFPSESWISAKLADEEIPVDMLDLKNDGLYGTARRIGAVVGRFRPETALCQLDISTSIMPLVLRCCGVGNIIMRWDNPLFRKNRGVFLLRWLQILFSGARQCACGSFVAEEFRKAFPFQEKRKVETIPNCVGEDWIRGPNGGRRRDSRMRIVSVGNLVEEKNHFDQIGIARNLKEKGVDFTLEIAGDGQLRGKLEAKIRQNGLDKNVFLPGQVEKVADFLGGADCFLFTSRSEGFGVAVVEAMASGLPCVAYALPSLEEIDGGRNAIQFVEQGDVGGAARMIRSLLEDRRRVEKISSESRSIVLENYLASVVKKKWLEYFSQPGAS